MKELKMTPSVAFKENSVYWLLTKDEKILPQRYSNLNEIRSARHLLIKQEKGIYIIERRATLNVVIPPGEKLSQKAAKMLKLN